MSTRFDHAQALQFFSDLFGGAHHIPGAGYAAGPKVKPWGDGFCVVTCSDLATFDADVLTRLVFLAHDRGYRAEVSPAMRHVRIAIHRRLLRDGGSMWERHPTLEAAVADWRQRHDPPSVASPASVHLRGDATDLEGA